MNRAGFTLLEVLVVLAILGILLAEGTGPYHGWAQSVAVREAAEELAVNITRAKTAAKRENTPWTLQVTGETSYELGPVGGTMQRVNLPDTVRLTTTGSSVVFIPPHGVRQSSSLGAPSFALQHHANPSKTRTVKVISIIGEVVVQ